MAYHYYILVFTQDGPKYVTGVKNLLNIHYLDDEVPKDFPRTYAEDIVSTLNSNKIDSVMVMSSYVINKHPY